MPDAGVLILVVGPSGAGKDTLIDHARRSLVHRGVGVARRVVTRPSSDAEPHETLDAEAFRQAAARGEFAICWQAHGLDYAIPIAIEARLARGEMIICNVSRGVVAALRARYARSFVIYVDAPLTVRQARVAGRKRAGEGAERVRREQRFTPDQADCTIDNGGDLAAACLAFEAAVLAATAS